MVVSFFGHREVGDEQSVREWLRNVIVQLIAEGANEFFFGGKGRFDFAAAEEVSKLKAQYPYLRRTLVQAYINQERNPLLHDECVYPPLERVPKRYAMLQRNRWMVRRAEVVVTYAQHSYGNTMAILQYARRQGKRTINYPES